MVTQADPNLNISKTGLEADFFILEKRSLENIPDLLPESSENNLTNEKSFETLYDAFKTYKRLVLLGEPGAGKTVALQEFQKNIFKKERQAENNSLVIFVSIQKWKYPADIVTFLAKEIGKTEEDFRKEIQTKRLLLLLDGLDELPSNVSKRSESRDAEIIDYRVHFLSKLSDFSRNLNRHNISIVMTCRKRDYEEIRRKIQKKKKDFKNIFHGLVVLNRLKNDEIKTYLKEINQKKLNNYSNGENIDLVWNTIQVKKDLLELIRTPFLLYVLSSTLVSIYQQNQSSISQGIEAIYKAVSNLEELLDKFVREQYKRESGKSKIPIPWSLNKVKRLLGQIAVLMMSDAVFMERKDPYSLVKKLVEKSDKTTKKDEWVAIVLLIYCDFLYEEKKYSEVLKRCEQAQIFIPEEAEDLRRSFEKLRSPSLKQEKKNDFKEDQIETESSPPIDLSKNIDLGKVSSDILSRLEKLENQRNTFSQQATQKEEKIELQPKQNSHPNEEKIEEDKEQKINSQTWSEKQANILKSDNEKLISQFKFWHLIVLIFPLYIIILVFLVYLIYQQNNSQDIIQTRNEQNNVPDKIQTRNEQNNMPDKIQPKNEQEYKKLNEQENKNLIESGILFAKNDRVDKGLENLCKIPRNSNSFREAKQWIKRWSKDDYWGPQLPSILEDFKEEGLSCPAADDADLRKY